MAHSAVWGYLSIQTQNKNDEDKLSDVDDSKLTDDVGDGN